MAEALAHELNCRYLQPLLDLGEAQASQELKTFIQGWAVTLPQLRDETNWVSLRFCEALTDWLGAKVGRQKLIDAVIEAFLSPKSLGFMYPLLRALGSPQAAYARIDALVGGLNKVSVVKVLEVTRGRAQVEYRPTSPEYRERSKLICELRQAQLAAGPRLWALPPAVIVEHECQADGGERCLYELRWAQRTGWLLGALGLLAGAASGFFFGWYVGAAMAIAGLSLGRLVDERRQSKELLTFNAEQNRGLLEASQANERRFVELQQAKAAVDQQVAERTAELRTASDQLRTSLEQLEQLGKVKDEFLANVSHELRTPLTLILGPLEDVLKGRAGPQSTQELTLAHQSALKLNSLVTELLLLARIQAGQLKLSTEQTDVAELVKHAADAFAPLSQRKKITLSVNAAPAQVPLDPRRVEFVLSNLLSNAFKFTPEGGTIELSVEPREKTVDVRVRDSGVGIAKEQLPKIFERFTKFEAKAAPGAAGTGIGLAVVKEIVELHGGTVTVSSEPGQGTTFTLSFKRDLAITADGSSGKAGADVPLPLRQEPPEQLGVEPATAAAAPVLEPDAPAVLVIDDNDEMRSFVARVLSRKYRVTSASRGQEGLDLLEKQTFDAVVCDVMMPGLSGYQVAQKMKESLSMRGTPILLLTARNDREWVLQGFQSGADDYLVKPFNSEELHARVEVQIRLRRLMNERVEREKLALLGSVAGGLAHEIRNPVTAILAGLPKLSRELETSNVRPAAKDMLKVAIDCAERISRMVGDVLTLGAPERPDVVPYDLHEGLDAAMRVLEHKAPPNVKFERDYHFEGKISCRPGAVNQVFLNLLDNALQAVADDGSVKVTTRDKDHGVAVTVSDSGPGVPPELQQRIFDPFFTTKAIGIGTGLGLHVSRQIVYAHKGTLELIPSTRGATFQVWLPLGEQ